MTRIFIDPGHGGEDNGAESHDLLEKDLCLEIAKHLNDILRHEYNDVQVKLSREEDEEIELSARAHMANDWDADYFVSIHINAGGGSGFESYIHESQPEKTADLQGKIHKKVIETTDVQDRGMKAANFAVLRETKMPALLTENLFIDHEEDAQKLSDSDFLKDLARGHAQGLAAAFDLEQARSEGDSDKKNSEDNNNSEDKNNSEFSDSNEADHSNDNSSAGSNNSDENNGSEEHEPQDPIDTPKKGSLLKRLFDWIRSKLF